MSRGIILFILPIFTKKTHIYVQLHTHKKKHSRKASMQSHDLLTYSLVVQRVAQGHFDMLGEDNRRPSLITSNFCHSIRTCSTVIHQTYIMVVDWINNHNKEDLSMHFFFFYVILENQSEKINNGETLLLGKDTFLKVHCCRMWWKCCQVNISQSVSFKRLKSLY